MSSSFIVPISLMIVLRVSTWNVAGGPRSLKNYTFLIGREGVFSPIGISKAKYCQSPLKKLSIFDSGSLPVLSQI